MIVDHRLSPDDKCEAKFSYSLQQILMVMIQKITGHPTHVIFTNISAEIDKMCKDFDIDFKKKSASLKWSDSYKRWITDRASTKRAVTYPGTDITFFIKMNIQWVDRTNTWGLYIHGKCLNKKEIVLNCNYVEIAAYVPQKRITFTEENVQEVLAEGDLLDMSQDLEAPKLKESKVRKKKKTKTDTIQE